MTHKGKLLGLLVLFAVIGLVTATGAFSTVQAERSATVGVAGDEAALVAVEPFDGPNGNGGASNAASDGYARIEDGTLQLNLGGYDDGVPRGLGVNKDATTDIPNVFVVTNQGARPVAVSVTDTDDDGADTAVTFYNPSYATRANGGLETDEGGSAVALGPGESIVVSVYVDTTSADPSDGTLVEGITISADANTIDAANDGPGGDKA